MARRHPTLQQAPAALTPDVDDNGITSITLPPTAVVSDNAISKYIWRCDDKVEKNHSDIFPRDIRAVIVGKSGSGKTILLMHLLLEADILDYDTLTVCGNSLHQSEYKVLNVGFSNGFSKNQVRTLFEQQAKLRKHYHGGIDEYIDRYKGPRKGGIDAQFLDNVEDIPDPKDHDPECKTLLVLDDIMLGPQNQAEAYYTRGRHNNVDSIYISQNYFRLPRQTVRENANLFMIFKQDAKNMSHIYQDHCTDVPFDQFRDFCSSVWDLGEHHFVTINLTKSGAHQGKYRRDLNDCWIPSRNNINRRLSYSLYHS